MNCSTAISNGLFNNDHLDSYETLSYYNPLPLYEKSSMEVTFQGTMIMMMADLMAEVY